MTRRAVFFDRDGVLNDGPLDDTNVSRPPRSARDLTVLPGVFDACRSLRDAGFLLVVVTNQPDVARGSAVREGVEEINRRLRRQLPIDDVLVCYHDTADGCGCRKPEPGLLVEAAERWDIDLSVSYLVGDRSSDIEAGQRAGCRTVLIPRGWGDDGSVQPDFVAPSAIAAAEWILHDVSSHRARRNVKQLSELKVKIFADGADRARFVELAEDPLIVGFTTNPTLMRKAGVTDYEAFGRDLLELAQDRPVSFEVFSDDFDEMERQARQLSSWGENVYVKVPVANCRGQSSCELLRRLAAEGVNVNVTALMTPAQVEEVSSALAGSEAGFVSLFAGRIADTGRDPVPLVVESVAILADHPQLELIWASPREVLNIFQADAAGCHVITATSDILSKLHLVGKNLEEFSTETVQMFYDDAAAANYRLFETPLATADRPTSAR